MTYEERMIKICDLQTEITTNQQKAHYDLQQKNKPLQKAIDDLKINHKSNYSNGYFIGCEM